MAVAHVVGDVKLKGVDKAAAFMLAIGEDLAARIMENMDQEEIKEISRAMAALGSVRSNVVEELFQDFTHNLSSTGNLNGSFETTERFLARILGRDRVKNIMEEISGPQGRTTWDKINNVNEDLLVNFLRNESPQTIAVILSRTKPEKASKIVPKLPTDIAVQAIIRMAHIEPLQKEIIENVEEILKKEFVNSLVLGARKDPNEHIANIFNSFERVTEQRLMEALENAEGTLAERVRSLMFTFQDLRKIGDMGVQVVIRKVDKGKLCLALKGASETIKDFFFGNMSERAVRLMKDDIQNLGAVRVKDVEDAQIMIVNMVKELSTNGELTIVNESAEEEKYIT